MPPKILIVDDEPDMEVLIRQQFRRQIRDGVYEFLFAANGEEALQLLQTEPGIDLVLSDINMPVMDGLTLLGRLRELPARLGTVIVSAYGDMRNIRAAMNLGAFDFLTKPIDFLDFELTVQKTLRQVHELRQADSDRVNLIAVERDLETAAEIQRSFLPSPEPALGQSYSLHATMLPAKVVGGDFYDYFFLDDHRLGFVVGDVSGKGVPAALFMAVVRTSLRATAHVAASPAACLERLNQQLLRDNASSLFVTLCYAILDTRTGMVEYALGGHPPPYLVRATGETKELDGKGLLVGVLENATFETMQVRLAPGDLLFLYSDGITEARRGDHELFGLERLKPGLQSADRSSARALVQSVLDVVKQFSGLAPQSDDLTALAVYCVPGSSPA